MSRIIIFCILLGYSQWSSALDIAPYSPKTETIEAKDFIPFIQVYQTPLELSSKTVYQKISTGAITQSPQQASQGFSQDYFWVLFSIKQHKNGFKKLVLELDNPHLDKVELYQQTAQKFDCIGYGGDRGKKFSERSYINRRFIFPLADNNESTVITFLLMIDKRNASVSFPLKIWDLDSFERYEARQNIYYGLFFGMLFFVSFISLAIGVTLRNKLFLLYGSYVLLMALYLFTALGFAFQYLYPFSTVFNNYARVLFIVFIAVLSTIFLRAYLELDKYLPKTAQIFKAINLILITLFLTWLIFFGLFRIYTVWILNLIYILLLLIFVFSYWATFKMLAINKANSLLYIFAFSSVVIGCLFSMSIEYGWIEENIFPLNPILMGSAVEVLVLSVAMVRYIRNILLSKQLLEQKNNQLTQSQQELEQTNTNLEQLNQQLHQQLKKGNIDTLRLKSGALLQLENIVLISSDGHYLEFYCANKSRPEVDRNSMKNILEQLPPNLFKRVHRGYIINIKQAKSYVSGQVLLTNGMTISVSRTYRNALKEALS
ncbi:MAG: hypothetical protein GY810_01575 [Aureispira sp.]|nr:hypothetical protein [Aureispira sp.]